MKRLGCRKFGRLLNELGDREATDRESRFLEAHRSACDACRREEEAASFTLDLLRGAVFEAEDEPVFERRIVRRARVAMVRDGVRYWSPALIGGAVAAGLLLAAVQALTTPLRPGTKAEMSAGRHAPSSLALNGVPIHFTR